MKVNKTSALLFFCGSSPNTSPATLQVAVNGTTMIMDTRNNEKQRDTGTASEHSSKSYSGFGGRFSYLNPRRNWVQNVQKTKRQITKSHGSTCTKLISASSSNVICIRLCVSMCVRECVRAYASAVYIIC
jgi:hypothetical protein